MVETIVITKGTRLPTPDPYLDHFVVSHRRPARAPRQSVLVGVVQAAERLSREERTAAMQDAQRLEAAEREQRAMDDGRHTLGGF